MVYPGIGKYIGVPNLVEHVDAVLSTIFDPIWDRVVALTAKKPSAEEKLRAEVEGQRYWYRREAEQQWWDRARALHRFELLRRSSVAPCSGM